ncbi:MAG: hypothetical protein N4A38_01210 [Candidatus Gracilibacteria bacterium]|nr:hypothetical protein [Candidatus Gracilibacteria bacterium]
MCTLKNFEKFFNEKIKIYKNNKIINSIGEEIDNLILHKENYKCLLTENSFDVKNKKGNGTIKTTHIARCYLNSGLEIGDTVINSKGEYLNVYYIKTIVNIYGSQDHQLVFLKK